ncbi:TRAP transporter substrate-binding protein [Pseudozobellia thermophila]|uniref:Tripartite ATP-independent transporter solute receptor, DctP family n=1 Tax=Pseudozobellia thermophila TaxID=192903 RepID=A0A1M6B6P9_9FLAO|nr:TRAP transporter substrate-binding protein [Pseudozobellia thermophila]SHI44429.1 tripartite ATP-independent transporter solute receptor, DctP family [Pseudozobellia thermophila]
MKHFFKSVVLCKYYLMGVVALAAITLQSCSSTSDEKVLYFAHSLPTSHPVHKGILAMQEALKENSGGKLQIKIFPDGQLGSEREAIELLQIGSIAMTKVSASALSNFAPEYQIMVIPYLFRDSDHLFRNLEGEVGKQLLESGTEYLLRGICFYDAGARSFYTKDKPVNSPDDLDGLKLRVQNDQMSVDMANTLGASATPMAFGELYTALQQNVVDGAENNIPSFVSSNHFEVCKYYIFDEHTRVPDVVVIGTKFWDSLSDEEKGWLEEAAEESVVKQKQYWHETVEENMKMLKEEGVEFIYPDQEPFIEKSRPIMERLMQNPKLKPMIEKINSN